MKGCIALDIDGTVTGDTHTLDDGVIAALEDFHAAGWNFIFITGRPYHWGFDTLRILPFPYALAVQNGALLLKMPDKQVLRRNYLKREILSLLDEVSQKEQTDGVIYSGFENGDWCFYRPNRLTQTMLNYVMERSQALGEKWQAVENYAALPVLTFPSFKYFAFQEQGMRLSRKLEHDLHLHAPLNRDPFNPEYYVIQATHPKATKGEVLKDFIQFNQIDGPLIAAGDDSNDLSMLNIADVKVVMANAPEELLKIADVIAPPANHHGIVQGLQQAIDRIDRRS